mmetsp:Transcript_5150/g.7132  ORF Transcript_5150/g.7132 Transcript_5150/m.7132 type:complete len:510 (+) Transcript_5150:55-1584(+)|eukprot:CAMPEP_0117754392 /NCGR_PEP_ID=MMETSP0947-20121206/12804_1 /TAXON_ID=44440 /ORGANISM="Chattonella subsalsa, Strain CCMP2191" /LENGTH=509 /DNA_ID=CAMNT_0005573477 /DNA_START=57 /DNA_END=1586 /DNA_ORIENTATION=+
MRRNSLLLLLLSLLLCFCDIDASFSRRHRRKLQDLGATINSPVVEDENINGQIERSPVDIGESKLRKEGGMPFQETAKNVSSQIGSGNELLEKLKAKDDELLSTLQQLHQVEKDYYSYKAQADAEKSNMTLHALQLQQVSASTTQRANALEDEKNRLQTSYDTCNAELIAAKEHKVAAENLRLTAQANLDETTRDLQEAQAKLHSCTEQFDEARGFKAELAKLREDYEVLLSAYSEIQEKYNDPAFDHFIEKKMEKFYAANPGLGGAYNKTADILVPKLLNTKKETFNLLNATHTNIQTRLSPYLPEHHVGVIAGLLLYGLIFLPMFLTVYCLTSCKGILHLRAVLFFSHVYFLIVCGIAGVSAMALDSDPLVLLHANNNGSYIIMNLIFSGLYCIYLFVVMILLLKMNIGLRFALRALQLVGICFIGTLYYRMIWTPAMIDKPPVRIFRNNLAVPYLIPAFIFALNLHIEHAYLRNAKDNANIRQTVQIQMQDVLDDAEEGKASAKSD